jgi:hypothetical protein
MKNNFFRNILRSFLALFNLKLYEKPYNPPFKPVMPESKVVAWWLTGVDADCMYQSRDEVPGLCPACKNVVDKIPNLDYYVTRTNHLQETYDGFTIVSEKFKMFCKVQHFDNVIFIPLRTPGGFYVMEPNDIFEVNKEYSDMPHDGDLCPVCGTYEWHGNRMIYSKEDFDDDANFIKRLDGLYGSSWKKFHVIIVGKKTAKLMKQFGLRGIYFHEVYYHP